MEPIKTKEQLLAESTVVAQNAAKMIGGNFTQEVGFSPISSSTLSGTATPLNLPTPTPPSTTGVAVTAKNLSLAEQAKANIDAEEQAYKEQAKITAETSKGKVADLFNNQQKAYDEKIAAYQTDEFKALKELKTKALNDQISLRKAQDAEIAALEKTPRDKNEIASATADINRRYAFQSAQLSLTSSIASNNYESAKQAIDDLYTLTMEKYTPMINYYTQLAQNDQKIFTDAEVKILENKRDDYKTLQTQEADTVKQIGALQIKASENSAPASVIQAIGNSKSYSEAVQAAGQYAGDVLGNELKRLQIEKAKRDLTGGGEVPTVKEINGVSMQWNPSTSKWEIPSGVSGGIGGSAGTTLPLAQAQGNVESINTLLTDKNIRSAVGPSILGRLVGRGYDALTGGRQNFISSVEQIRSNLNLEALIGAKARGATFGALSDQELQVLASSATKIGTWAIKNKSGQVTGYNASEKDFKKELDKINNYAKLDYILKGGAPEDVGAVLMTDGKYYSQNSDGTYTQLTN